jgi:hypothetical protein
MEGVCLGEEFAHRMDDSHLQSLVGMRRYKDDADETEPGIERNGESNIDRDILFCYG